MEDDESFVVFNIIFDTWNFGVEVNHEMRASAIKGVYKIRGKKRMRIRKYNNYWGPHSKIA